MQEEATMKCKVFNIRLHEEHRTSDEAAIDRFLSTLNPKRIFASIAGEHDDQWSVLLFIEDQPLGTGEEHEGEEDIVLTPDEEMDYEDLKKWRNERANQDGFPPFIIAHNIWLKKMVKLPVRTREDLSRIKGFGQKRTEKYGEDILRILAAPRDARRVTEP
jgi:superfamily II DNA helicase RecQ